MRVVNNFHVENGNKFLYFYSNLNNKANERKRAKNVQFLFVSYVTSFNDGNIDIT